MANTLNGKECGKSCEAESQIGNSCARMNNNLAMSDRVSWAMVLFACLLQIVLGTALARSSLPLCDEGFYGVPAQVLSVTGALRNPVLEPAGIKYLRGIDRTFYWMAPVGMVLQAGAFKVFGFGLLVQRELSVVCGLGVVLLWHLALRHLLQDRVAALTSVLLSVDFVFLSLSSRGRSDTISLFFAMAALAGYMHWRERSLALALAVANTACALSGMVHPNGGIAAVTSLVALTLYLDRTRLRWSYLAVVAVCYGVLGLGWGLYIAKAPDLFVAQFFGNVAGRLGGPMTLTRMIKGEVTRYLSAYGLENAHGVKLVRYLLPVSYLSAIMFCAFSKDLRRRSGVLLMMFVGVSLTLVFLEGTKQGPYLVHLSPLFCAFLAISANRLWESGNIMARMITAAQALIVLLGVASLAYTASNRNLQRLYQPTVAFLNAHVRPGDVVFARSEFYFGLQCRTCLRDDANLGALSGWRAEYIVLDPDYTGHLEELREKSPVIYRDIEQRLKTDYQEVFRNLNYQVMRRTAAS
jgi:4-amino-4-deoxy-L-arabinose transferase-like glycosyltransferase